MMTSPSPVQPDLLAQLQQQMTDFGVSSVFDVVNKSCAQLIHDYQDRFSPETITAFYRAAQSRASQITRHHLNHHASGAFSLSPLARSIKRATWPELFPEDNNAFCPPDSIESVDSPVAYLNNLYRLALDIESRAGGDAQTLAQRRPDLASLLIDADSANTALPTQQLVSEILQQKLQLGSDQSLAQVLASHRYPFMLPYDSAASITHLGLPALNTRWDEVVLETMPQPAFLAATTDADATRHLRQSQRAGLALAPELMALCREQPVWYSAVLCNQHDITDSDGQPVDLLSLHGPDITPLLPNLPAQATVSDYNQAFIVPPQPHVVCDPPANALVEDTGALLGEYTALSLTCQPLVGSNQPLTVTLIGHNIEERNPDDVVTDQVRPIHATHPRKGDPRKRYLRLRLDAASLGTLDANAAWIGELRICAREYYSQQDMAEFRYAVIIQGSNNRATQQLARLYADTHYGQPLYDQVVAAPLLQLPLTPLLESCQLTRSELEKQLCLQEAVPTVSDACAPVADSAFPAAWQFGAVWLHGGHGPAITLTDDYLVGPALMLNRLHVFLRLQQALGLNNVQLDRLLTACDRAQYQGATGDMPISGCTLRALGLFQQWQDRYQISAEHFAALLDEVSPFSIQPDPAFFDRLFNRQCSEEEKLRLDNALFEHSPAGELSAWSKRLCAGLKISENDWRLLAPRLENALHTRIAAGAAADGSSESLSGKLRRSLFVVSAFFRVVSLFRLLGCDVEDGMALVGLPGNDTDNIWQQLAGQPRLYDRLSSEPGAGAIDATLAGKDDILDVLVRLEQQARFLQQMNTSPVALAFMLAENATATDTDPLRQWFSTLVSTLTPALVTADWLLALQLPLTDNDAAALHWPRILSTLVDTQGLLDATLTADNLAAAVVSATAELKLSDLATVQQTLSAALGAQLDSQHKIARNALATYFSLTEPLVSALLRWMTLTPYQLFSVALSCTATATSAAGLALMARLTRYVMVINGLRLSPQVISALADRPADWQATPASLTLTLIWHLCCFAELRDSVDNGEALILSWLSRSNDDNALPQLKTLFGFSDSDAQSALAQGGLATVAGLSRLLRQRNLAHRSGLALSTLIYAATLAPEADLTTRQPLADSLLHSLRAHSQENI